MKLIVLQVIICFEQTKALIRSNPKVVRKFKLNKLEITLKKNNSKFQPLASEEKTLDCRFNISIASLLLTVNEARRKMNWNYLKGMDRPIVMSRTCTINENDEVVGVNSEPTKGSDENKQIGI